MNSNISLERVLELVRERYEAASKLPHIRKPLAFALYQVWKEVDAE